MFYGPGKRNTAAIETSRHDGQKTHLMNSA